MTHGLTMYLAVAVLISIFPGLASEAVTTESLDSAEAIVARTGAWQGTIGEVTEADVRDMVEKAYSEESACIISEAVNSTAGKPDKISGTWKGKLKAENVELTIVFHFNDGECLMDSPEQGAKGILCQINMVSADSANISVPKIGIVYAAKLRDGKLAGTFIQMGQKFPLILEQGDIVRNRPQTPCPPFPYTNEEVSFRNGYAVLSGTLTWPEGWDGKKKVPVLLMVSGSGLQDRNEELFDHKPFMVLADALARKGIATLRYDDRGFGKSTGSAAKATTMDFADDAEAGIHFLKNHGGFSMIGVLGHSEGGAIAFILAARKRTDFIVTLAAPSVQGDSIMLMQNKLAAERQGAGFDLTRDQFRQQLEASSNPWTSFFMDYDPARDIAATRCPALILNGEKDTQVNAETNIGAIRRHLPSNRETVIRTYPGLNHLFQHCNTGFPEEYGRIEQTISPEVTNDIIQWINSL